jgi:hypothetical protein
MSASVNQITAETLTAVGRGIDRDTARTDAYDQILAILKNQYKLTPEIFRVKKRVNVIKTFSGAAQVEQEERDRGEEVYFEKKKSAQKGKQDWRLIVQSKETGKRRLVGTVTVSKDSTGFARAKEELLQRYLDQRK